MTTHRDPDVTDPATAGGPGGPGGHRWMMIACCIPMLVIAIVLVVTGFVSIIFRP